MEEALKPVIFPGDIDGFTFVEYLIMFTSLVFAFAASEYFISIGKMIKAWKRIESYWEFIVWVVLIFFMLISYWYINWLRMDYINNNLLSFFLLILPTFIFFLIVSIFFPEFNQDKYYDLKVHFSNNINKVFILIAIYLGVNIIVEILYPTEGQAHALVTQTIFLAITVFHVFFPRQIIRLFMVGLFSFQIIFVFIHLHS